MTHDPDRVAAGTLIDGKYRVVRLLGQGGMGAVYEVENVKVRRSAALKLLPRTATAEIVARFEAEAQAAGRAGSKRIVDVLDLGRTSEGQPYMVMELLEGETLRDELKRTRRMSPKRAATLLVDVLVGLEAAHAAGIVHRDLKPENIWVLAEPPEPRPVTGEAPIVKVLDFGVSRFTTGEADGAGRPRTAEGTMIGTCWYMSPEQIRDARNADARADVYAIGVMLYELVSGNVPFPGGTMPELFFRILEEPAPDPRKAMAAFPGTLAEIALRALQKKPEDRFATAAELREHLVAYLEERTPLHIDLGALDIPVTREAAPAPRAAPAPLDIALDTPERTRPSTLETWRATLDSPRGPAPPPGETLEGPSVAPATPRGGASHPETVPFPLVVPGAHAPATGSGPVTPTPTTPSPVAGAPATPRSPLAAPASDIVLGPPPSESTASPSGPRSAPRSGPISGPFNPSAVELAALPQRVDAAPPPAWPRGAIVVGALALAVIGVALVVGLLLRADVLGG